MKKIATTTFLMLATIFMSAGSLFAQFSPVNTANTEFRYQLPPATSNTTILWEQEVNGNSGIVSDRFMGMPNTPIVLAADDFVLTERSEIQTVFIPGFINAQDFAARGAGFELFIFADNNSAPSGTPIQPSAILWYGNFGMNSNGLTINDEGIVVEFTVDIFAAGGEKLILEPGRYWVGGSAKVNSPNIEGNTRWNWYQGENKETQAHLIDPNNLFGGGFTNWTSFGTLGLTFTNLAFRIEGISGVEDVVPGPFGLLTPADNTVLTLEADNSTIVNIS